MISLFSINLIAYWRFPKSPNRVGTIKNYTMKKASLKFNPPKLFHKAEETHQKISLK